MDQKDEIKQKVDIAELIGEYLELKPASANSFKALCPFHSEKTPSFHVSGEKQIWKCFGCGEGGDCFDFLMKMEGLDFSETLRNLGHRVGVEIKRFSSAQSNLSQRLSEINHLAAKFYEKVLWDSQAAQSARDYLAKRGIDRDLAEKFGLGFAPAAWDTLSQFLLKKGYSASEGVQAGLMINKRQGSGQIDRFRNRLMIPLRDQHGNTVGFTGRQMPGDDFGPKYMNSPETPIYHKSKILFGLDLAKRAIKEQGNAIIVEGNLDVAASHKAGVANTVASSGTALTQDQLNLLKRHTNTLAFSFDADAAGFKAAYKGINLARDLGFDVRVISLPEGAGKDPDEAVQKDPEIWRRAVRETKPIMEYFLNQAVAGKDLKKVEDKKQVAAFVLPELAKIKDLVEREHWLSLLADWLRMDASVLRPALEHQSVSPKPGFAIQKPAVRPRLSSQAEKAAEYVLGFFVQHPASRVQIAASLQPENLVSDSLRVLYKELIFLYNHPENETLSTQSLFGRVRSRLEGQADYSKLVPLLDKISLQGEQMAANLTSQEVSQQLNQLLQIIIAANASQRRRDLAARIRLAEAKGDRSEAQRLIAKYNEP